MCKDVMFNKIEALFAHMKEVHQGRLFKEAPPHDGQTA